jgi:hypothetical protein
MLVGGGYAKGQVGRNDPAVGEPGRGNQFGHAFAPLSAMSAERQRQSSARFEHEAYLT